MKQMLEKPETPIPKYPEISPKLLNLNFLYPHFIGKFSKMADAYRHISFGLE